MGNVELLARVDRLDLIMPQIIKRFHRIPSQAQPAPSLSIAQLRMLVLLEADGDLSMGELARRASVTMPTATSSVNALVASRHVTRRRSARDRRVVVVSLTARGRKVLGAFHKQRRERLAALFGHLSPDDQERFVRAFETIYEIIRDLDQVEEPAPSANHEAGATR